MSFVQVCGGENHGGGGGGVVVSTLLLSTRNHKIFLGKVEEKESPDFPF